MGKRRIDQIAGRNPWVFETHHWIRKVRKVRIGKQPIDPDTARRLTIDTARGLTILRWMYGGNLRPLAAAIRSHVRCRLRKGLPEDRELNPAVLLLLARMIDDGRLSVKRRGRGNKDPAIFARDLLMLHLREREKKSEKEIADELDMTLEAVHQQLIKARKMRRNGFT